ncbi:sugar phosphate isomerase/epimerase family protein [Paenibacillus thalictri]|uniref:Sugar phosphate isomerase/epimerase n=1 Tax=Paenibacillus thalictri TaxID=2527873 RepID=A0A4Q9DP32_9BACL|nr:sugar phosphate isomerase/epimerase [Paenibacillus thalictri]TBL77864.1 sugar phosphate isomerase/epimerase [Paenibacillus thalictri]
MRERFAVQLYTLRNEIEADFPGVLKQLQTMGWAGVQMRVPQAYKPAEAARIAKELGIVTAGMHFPIDRLEHDVDGVAAEAELFGTKDIICPYLTEDWRNEEGYRKVKRILTEAAAKLGPAGYRISYHNHDFEFYTQVDGASALEYILDPAGGNPILAEIDVYWVKKAGGDPLAFIDRYAGRMPIIHLKDMTADDKRTFAAIGTGSIDFAPILSWCVNSGVEWLVVEQDVCPGDPMESVKISLDNLNKLADRLEAGAV